MHHEVSVAMAPDVSQDVEIPVIPEKFLRPSRLRIAVGIATRGRPDVLQETLQDLRKQIKKPDAILVSYADETDIGDIREFFPEVSFLQSEPGLTRQRNTILRALKQEDIVTFLDDDFYLRPDYLEKIDEAFHAHPEVVVATGSVLADGILGAGLTYSDAKAVLKMNPPAGNSEKLPKIFNAYGCNMSLRLQPIREHQLAFDEALPLYGWYEDVDFSRQLAAYGTVVKITDAYGVHLGVKGGRQSGVRLGYSQIANPVYLARKRSVSWTYAVASMVSRSMKNLVKTLHPEPFVDRRGRLQGNVKAWRDLCRNKIHPTRILDL